MIGLKKANRLLQKIFAFLYLISRMDWLKIFKNYRLRSRNVLWIKTNPLFTPISYLSKGDLLDDLIILNYLAERGEYTIRGAKGIGKIWNSNIYFSVTASYNPNRFYNYSKSLSTIVNHLEGQKNIVSPPSRVIQFWENKIFMHEEFERNNIPTPKTLIARCGEELPPFSFDNDFLIKLPHSSGSKGIFSCTNREMITQFDGIRKVPEHSPFLLQERIEIISDLRIVINEFKVFSHYWRRNNPNEKWRPTSTSRGSTIDYEDIPINVRKLVEETALALELPFCAYDIVFRNQDNNDPLILEVSSSYQLNPRSEKKMLYRDYKRQLFSANPYWKQYVRITIDEIHKQLDYYGKHN